MPLTALAVIVGASVILAIALMPGEITSLFISRMAIPMLLFHGEQDARQDAR